MPSLFATCQEQAENGLPEKAPLRQNDRVMLDRKRLDWFYHEFQVRLRIQANTPIPQVEETAEDFKSRLTQSSVAKTDAVSEPGNREAEAMTALDASVTRKMRLDSAIGDGHLKRRGEKVFELFPDEASSGISFHEFLLKREMALKKR